MSRQSRLIWRGYLVEWAYEGFKSKRDLTYHPHFTLRAFDDTSKVSITYDDVVINDKELKGITDFTKLPMEVMDRCLNELIDTLEKEIKGWTATNAKTT